MFVSCRHGPKYFVSCRVLDRAKQLCRSPPKNSTAQVPSSGANCCKAPPKPSRALHQQPAGSVLRTRPRLDLFPIIFPPVFFIASTFRNCVVSKLTHHHTTHTSNPLTSLVRKLELQSIPRLNTTAESYDSCGTSV